MAYVPLRWLEPTHQLFRIAAQNLKEAGEANSAAEVHPFAFTVRFRPYALHGGGALGDKIDALDRMAGKRISIASVPSKGRSGRVPGSPSSQRAAVTPALTRPCRNSRVRRRTRQEQGCISDNSKPCSLHLPSPSEQQHQAVICRPMILLKGKHVPLPRLHESIPNSGRRGGCHRSCLPPCPA